MCYMDNDFFFLMANHQWSDQMTTISIFFSMELHGGEEYLVAHPLILPVWLTIDLFKSNQLQFWES